MRTIQPVVIYPYGNPHCDALGHLEYLYKGLDGLAEDNQQYVRPITVVNCQTRDRSTAEERALFDGEITRVSQDVIEAWCVDTCQAWLAGLGGACDRYGDNAGNVVYWLVPGDFDYASPNGRALFERMRELPETVAQPTPAIQLCLGEVQADQSSSKQLIDTYGTYGLLYNWFPKEAGIIRAKTTKPRTEFLAIDGSFLIKLLATRWYAYEQTIVMLLHAIIGAREVHRVEAIDLGPAVDDPSGRNQLSSAMQQIERMERVLKLFWRERRQEISSRSWVNEFRRLEDQSEQIRGTAMVIFEQALAAGGTYV